MCSSFRIFHGHNSVFARFSARDSDICTCYFNDIKISMFWYQPHCWETRKNWVMPMKYSKTRRHYLEHVWKLVGGVVPNTPPGGPELEHFTSVEGHRSNLSGNDCRRKKQFWDQGYNFEFKFLPLDILELTNVWHVQNRSEISLIWIFSWFMRSGLRFTS